MLQIMKGVSYIQSYVINAIKEDKKGVRILNGAERREIHPNKHR